jgi:hypothetical protein
MDKHIFWQLLFLSSLLFQSLQAAELRVETLSEGSCWYENKEVIRITSYNDKTAYFGTLKQIESEFDVLIPQNIKKTENSKIQDFDLSLHCGGYGASLVAKFRVDGHLLCAWAKFDNGKLSLRSFGLMSETKKNTNELCDGHKFSELIIGVQSEEFTNELQSVKWSSMIKEVIQVTDKVIKVVLVKEYELRENEVIEQLKENFGGQNLIRYIEFNDYRHPVGEYVRL